MKLDDIRPSVESSGGMKEEFFSIEDQGMIFEILRNKMYSDPIRAICREISCNARDAHREVGTPERPIQITLPSALEPFYKVKDWGPGISPDRMSNIFIRYTASTKRSDNLQTGGFGLGAKTPFSYSDTFTILTVHNGIEYNYACFIDETKVGKLALLSSSPTDKENSTELMIPVSRYHDYNLFKEATHTSTKHWDVKPIIKGGTIDYDTANEPVISGSGWAIYNEGWNRDTKIIIDGIEYPVDMTELRKFADRKVIDNCSAQIRLYFGVGELTLAANREQVYLDDRTKSAISNRINEMKNEIKSEVESKLEAIPNLWDAQVFFHKELHRSFSNLEFLGDVKWNGIVLVHSIYGIRTGCSVYSYLRISGRVTRNTNNGKLSFDDKAVLFVNDTQLSEPNARYFKKFFEENTDVKHVVLVCPNGGKTEEDLNKEINLDKMAPRRLSSIISYKGKNKNLRSRLLVFKFDKISNNFRQIKIEDFDSSNNKKILVRLKKDDYNPSIKIVAKVKHNISPTIITYILTRFPNVEFYGIDVGIDDDRIEESLPGCGNYDEFIEENILNAGFDFLMMKAVARGLSRGYSYNWIKLDCLYEVEKLINDPNSHFLWVCAAFKMLNAITENNNLVDVVEMIKGKYISIEEVDDYLYNNPHMQARTYIDMLKEKYPMISFLNGSEISDNSQAVADYINMVDGWMRI